MEDAGANSHPVRPGEIRIASSHASSSLNNGRGFFCCPSDKILLDTFWPIIGTGMKAANYETVASTMALGGAMLFGFGMFPYLNPIWFGLIFGWEYLPASIVSLPVSVLIMWNAWRLSQKGQRLKELKKEKSKLESDPSN